MFRESILSSVKCVRGLCEIQRVRLDYRKAWERVVDARRVRFDHRKACRKLVETRIPYTRVNKRIRLFQKLQGNMRLIMRDKN